MSEIRDRMTLAEASAYLALDERTVLQLAEERRLPAVREEGRWVFSRKSLQKWRELQARWRQTA